jgi:hypothetical protein
VRFYSPEECASHCALLKVELDARRQPTRDLDFQYRLRCELPPSFTQLLWFSRTIEAALQPRAACLVWATGFGIFPSNENEHLYYRLRQSYGDLRLLHEAPGHLCLGYEQAEVVTLVHLGILFGWDVHLIPTQGHARAFVCHDEWVDLGFASQAQFEETRAQLQGAKMNVLVPG